MTLSLVYKIFGVINLIFALMMGLAPGMISETSGWGEVTIGITTMSEHYGSALLVLGVIFWMLPSWTSEEQLKKATMTMIVLQIFLFLVPIYHVGVGAIPQDAFFYIFSILHLVLIGLLYLKSR